MSINPEHVENIMSGKKKYEFRKVMPIKDVNKIIFYATAPIKKVVGEADVVDVIVGYLEPIWNKTAPYAGITKQFFDDYYFERERAIVYQLDNAHKFEQPKELSDYGIKTVPQSFVYVEDICE
jgi:predicted transcriptional regulator